MQHLFHAIANRAAALLMKFIFGSIARVHVLGRENTMREGGLLLAANHISHFDPFLISAIVRRKIDWMAMAEFFPYPVLGQFLRAVDAFPAKRDRADRATIRTAIERLRNGRIVGIFPEGGIRDGKNSILEGAASRSGVASLSHLAAVPVLPCVILGTDRLYNRRRWNPLRKTPIWIAFGAPILPDRISDKATARGFIDQAFTSSLTRLRDELWQKFSLTAHDLPHPPRERMREEMT
jgi:1-acyl-sn-glycerol-3-phosphate acyltransferase